MSKLTIAGIFDRRVDARAVLLMKGANEASVKLRGAARLRQVEPNEEDALKY